MSGHQTATIEDTVFFWFAANDTSGSGGDGASPLFDVREAGAAASAIPLLSGTPTLLTHANFPAGCHEIAVAATTGNGFAADDTFAVYCTLAIDSQNPTGFVGSCTLTPLAKTAALATLTTELAILTDATILTSATIETVTDQLNFIIPATADATDDDAYNNAVAVFIDGSDPNQKSYRSVKNYTASTRSIEIRRAPDFTVTTSDTITLLTTDPHVFTHSKDVIGTIEALRGHHTAQPIGNVFYVDTTNGASFASGARGGINDPLASIQDCEDNLVVDSNHDVVFILAGASGQTTIDEAVTLAKRYTFWRGPGRDVIWTRTTNGNTIAITGDGIEISGVQIGTHSTGSGNGIDISSADFVSVRHCWILDTRGDGIRITTSDNCVIEENSFAGTGVSGSGQGIHIVGTAGTSNNNNIFHNHFSSTAGDAILIEGGTTNDTIIAFNAMSNSGGWGINVGASSTDAIVHDNTFGNNSSGNIQDNGINSILLNNEQWGTSTALAIVDTNVDQIETAVITNAAGVDIAADIIALKTATDAIPTTAMRGTDNALLAASINLTGGAVDVVTTLTGHTAQTGDNFARLGAPAGASVSADLAAVKADTIIPAKNVAFDNISVFMVDDTDHVTPKTGLSVTVQRSIDGGAFSNATGSIAEISNGVYQLDASQADMNGDIITFKFSGTDADDAFLTTVTR